MRHEMEEMPIEWEFLEANQPSVNPLADAFVGSSPTPPTSRRACGAAAGKPADREEPAEVLPKASSHVGICVRGCSSMVEQQPSKLMTRVRFPSPAPILSVVYGAARRRLSYRSAKHSFGYDQQRRQGANDS